MLVPWPLGGAHAVLPWLAMVVADVVGAAQGQERNREDPDCGARPQPLWRTRGGAWRALR